MLDTIVTVLIVIGVGVLALAVVGAILAFISDAWSR